MQVGFLVAIGDFSAPLGLPPVALLPLLGTFVLWPLSLLPSLHSLWLPSVLSILAVCAVASVIVVRALQVDAPGSGCPTSSSSGTAATLPLMAWPDSVERALECVPILLFGFTAHLQAPIVACELHTAAAASVTRTHFVMQLSILCALAVCALLYATTALAGVICYGAQTRNDVLANLGVEAASAGGDPLAAIAGAAMAAHLTLGYPILLFPLLASAQHVVSAAGGARRARIVVVDLPSDADGAADAPSGERGGDGGGGGGGGALPLLQHAHGGGGLSSGGESGGDGDGDGDGGGSRGSDGGAGGGSRDGGGAGGGSGSTRRGERRDAPVMHPPCCHAAHGRSWHAARAALLIGTSISVALVAGHRLNVVFTLLGGSSGACLDCYFPAALLVAEGRMLIRRSEGDVGGAAAAYGRGVRCLLLACGLALVGLIALAGTVITLRRSFGVDLDR